MEDEAWKYLSYGGSIGKRNLANLELGMRENCGICLSYEERVFLLVECRLPLKEVGGLRREVFELLSDRLSL